MHISTRKVWNKFYFKHLLRNDLNFMLSRTDTENFHGKKLHDLPVTHSK